MHRRFKTRVVANVGELRAVVVDISPADHLIDHEADFSEDCFQGKYDRIVKFVVWPIGVKFPPEPDDESAEMKPAAVGVMQLVHRIDDCSSGTGDWAPRELTARWLITQSAGLVGIEKNEQGCVVLQERPEGNFVSLQAAANKLAYMHMLHRWSRGTQDRMGAHDLLTMAAQRLVAGLENAGDAAFRMSVMADMHVLARQATEELFNDYCELVD